MGILDEAIREHLELKRQHGAADPELQKLEDEAFGEPARPGDEEAGAMGAPDEFGEAPTEFMPSAGADAAVAQPPAEAAPSSPEAAEAAAAAMPPPPPPVPAPEEAPAAPPPPPEPPAAEAPEPESEAAEEEHPAMEHEAVSEPPAPQPTQEELDRQAIADQPTELFDVEGELAAAQESPSEEDLFEAEAGEPRLDSAEPVEEEIDLDDDFFDEQSLSAELDQALDAPPGEGEAPAGPEPESAEIETAEPEPAEAEDAPEPDSAEPEAAEPEPASEPEPGQDEEAERGGAFFDQEEDVLEETPEFLQDTPESDRLWFEQKPPKDFDFDD